MGTLWTLDSIKSLKNLLNPDECSSDDEDGNGVIRSVAPGDIGPKRKQEPKKKIPQVNPYAIWDPEEIPDAEEAADVYDPRPQPEYEIFFKQNVSPEDIFLQLGNKNPTTASSEYTVARRFDIRIWDGRVCVVSAHNNAEMSEVYGLCEISGFQWKLTECPEPICFRLSRRWYKCIWHLASPPDFQIYYHDDGLKVRVKLPLTSMDQINIDIKEQFVDLRTPKYKLGLHLPNPVKPDSSNAKWITEKSTLEITLMNNREFDFMNF